MTITVIWKGFLGSSIRFSFDIEARVEAGSTGYCELEIRYREQKIKCQFLVYFPLNRKQRPLSSPVCLSVRLLVPH
jgi:hypothetical protein